ncbi:MAG: hypothetical protein GF334_02885, partial [Candidatus Altiarchaeales archaeon]|nr:hypothetical protein [Candidatus Altiarchaeales archaeon]
MDFTLMPVTGKKLVGRKEIVQDMIRILEKGGGGYALYGIRKVGKTSILREVQNNLNKRPHTNCVFIDAWNYDSRDLTDFFIELTNQIVDIYAKDLGLKTKIS